MLLSTILSPLLGSALGGFFAWLKGNQELETKRIDNAAKAANNAQELALRDKDIALANAEAAGRKDVAIVEGEALIESTRFKAIADIESAEVTTADEIKAAGFWGFLLVFASAMRKSVRPVLTYAMIGTALWLNILILRHLLAGWELFSKEQQLEVGLQCLAWILTQGSGIITYWFMSRKSA